MTSFLSLWHCGSLASRPLRLVFENNWLSHCSCSTRSRSMNNFFVILQNGWLNLLLVVLCNQYWHFLFTQTNETYLVKVDGHGAVAHLRGFMVGVTDGWKCHPAGSWPHRHSQGITRWFGRGGGVAHHQTLSLQHDWLCVILATDLWGPPKDQKQQSNEKDWVETKPRWRGRRWTRHSSKWGWTLGVFGLAWCFYSQHGDCMATSNLQKDRVFLEYTSL